MKVPENYKDKKQYCYNCYHPIGYDSSYCSHCGQKHTTGKVSVLEWLKDAFNELVDLDSRFLWTPIRLCIPGFLTNTYFKGRHKSYTKPLRIFLVFTILNFFLIQFLYRDSLTMDMNTPEKRLRKEFIQKDTYLDLDTVRLNLVQENLHDTALVNIVFDSIRAQMNINPALYKNDSTLLKDIVDFTISTDFDYPNLKIAKKDLLDLSPRELAERYEVKGLWNRLLFQQNVKVVKGADDIGVSIVEKFSWGIFIMTPIVSFLMWLLYFRHKKYFVEHLVFNFHVHAFIFMVYSILLLVNYYVVEVQESIWWLTLLLIFVYIYKALRNVYKQSRGKTFLKLLFLSFVYSILSIFVVVFIIIVGFILY